MKEGLRMAMGDVTPMAVMPLASYERLVAEAREAGREEVRKAMQETDKVFAQGHWDGQFAMKARIADALAKGSAPTWVSDVVRGVPVLQPAALPEIAEADKVQRFVARVDDILSTKDGGVQWGVWDNVEGRWHNRLRWWQEEAVAIAAQLSHMAAEPDPLADLPRLSAQWRGVKYDFKGQRDRSREWGVWDRRDAVFLNDCLVSREEAGSIARSYNEINTKLTGSGGPGDAKGAEG
ncbi:MAG: hypothetical protein ACHQ7M_22880 [Chloroflexota bacterium]|jgi:hypothetical protein